MAVHGRDAGEQEAVVGDMSRMVTAHDTFPSPRTWPVTQIEFSEYRRMQRRATYEHHRRRGLTALDALAASMPHNPLPSHPEWRLVLRGMGHPHRVAAPLTRSEKNKIAEVYWLIRKGWIMGPRRSLVDDRLQTHRLGRPAVGRRAVCLSWVDAASR